MWSWSGGGGGEQGPGEQPVLADVWEHGTNPSPPHSEEALEACAAAWQVPGTPDPMETHSRKWDWSGISESGC